MRNLKIRLSAVLIIVIFLIAAISLTANAVGVRLNDWIYEAAGLVEDTEILDDVRIALIDTGISTKRIDPERLEPGKNYVFDGADTEDLDGHGTRIASLILGCTNEKGTLQPTAPNAKLIPLAYHSRYPSGVPKNGGIEAICQAIYDAVDVYQCKIINISSGIIIHDERLEAAVAYAEEHNVIIVSAAGNDNLRSPERQYYPAAYDTVVGVGAINSLLEPTKFSQRNNVMIYAPGENISAVSIKNSKVFETISGTSYAAAFVSALAANMLGRYPEMTPEDFRETLKNSADGQINFQNAFNYYEGFIKNQKETENNE